MALSANITANREDNKTSQLMRTSLPNLPADDVIAGPEQQLAARSHPIQADAKIQISTSHTGAPKLTFQLIAYGKRGVKTDTPACINADYSARHRAFAAPWHHWPGFTTGFTLRRRLLANKSHGLYICWQSVSLFRADASYGGAHRLKMAAAASDGCHYSDWLLSGKSNCDGNRWHLAL